MPLLQVGTKERKEGVIPKRAFSSDARDLARSCYAAGGTGALFLELFTD